MKRLSSALKPKITNGALTIQKPLHKSISILFFPRNHFSSQEQEEKQPGFFRKSFNLISDMVKTRSISQPIQDRLMDSQIETSAESEKRFFRFIHDNAPFNSFQQYHDLLKFHYDIAHSKLREDPPELVKLKHKMTVCDLLTKMEDQAIQENQDYEPRFPDDDDDETIKHKYTPGQMGWKRRLRDRVNSEINKKVHEQYPSLSVSELENLRLEKIYFSEIGSFLQSHDVCPANQTEMTELLRVRRFKFSAGRMPKQQLEIMRKYERLKKFHAPDRPKSMKVN